MSFRTMDPMPQAPHQVSIVGHPLVAHLVTEARDATTPPQRFRRIVEQLGVLLAFEATRDLALSTRSVATPMEGFEGAQLCQTISIVPILRAGLGMVPGMLDMIPGARVGHIGVFRDEHRLEPVQYYVKLPLQVDQGPVLLVDPMLATGGSAAHAVTLLKEHGFRDVRMLCIIAAPQGVRSLNQAHPDVPIHAAALDRELDGRGYILPGLGDAGDRLFGTLDQAT